MSEDFSKANLILKTKNNFQDDNSYLEGLFKIVPKFFNMEYQNGLNYQSKNKNMKLTVAMKRNAKKELPKLIKGIEEEG